MKLNFWQILGVLLILVAVSFLVARRTGGDRPGNPVQPVAPSPDALPMSDALPPSSTLPTTMP